MKRILQFTTSTFIALTLTACLNGIRGSGELKTETRPVSGFSSVELSGIGKLIINQTGKESLTIEAEENLLQYITTEVRGDRLVIGTKSFVSFNATRPIVFRLDVKYLEGITLGGSGDIEAGDLKSDRLVAEISGSGELKVGKVSAREFQFKGNGSGGLESREIKGDNADLMLLGSGGVMIDNLDAKNLTVQENASGSVRLSGRVDVQDIKISGAGSYTAPDLDSVTAAINITGSGSATVNVRERLNATIIGSGSVVYSGDAEVQKRVTGSGSISKR